MLVSFGFSDFNSTIPRRPLFHTIRLNELRVSEVSGASARPLLSTVCLSVQGTGSVRCRSGIRGDKLTTTIFPAACRRTIEPLTQPVAHLFRGGWHWLNELRVSEVSGASARPLLLRVHTPVQGTGSVRCRCGFRGDKLTTTIFQAACRRTTEPLTQPVAHSFRGGGGTG